MLTGTRRWFGPLPTFLLVLQLGGVCAAITGDDPCFPAHCGLGPPGPGFNDPARIGAMLSVHAYARWPNAHFPAGLRVIPLRQAATFLCRDPGAFAMSRRRRAIATLAAHGLNLPLFREAICSLGFNPAMIDAALANQDRAIPGVPVPPGGSPTGGGRRIRILSPRELQTFVYDMLPDLSIPGCPTTNLDVAPADDDAPEASGTASIAIQKDVVSVAKALDPQSWDVCSKFFKPPERTYLAHEDTTPEPVIPAGEAYGGTKGTAELLFEWFTCPDTDPNGNPTGCGAWFKNLLSVSTFWPDQTTLGHRDYEVRFSFHKFLGGQVTALPKIDAEIETDDGGASAVESPSPGPVTATGWKTLRFVNPGLTGAAKAIIDVMVDETTGEFAELACCPITAAPDAPVLEDVTPVP